MTIDGSASTRKETPLLTESQPSQPLSRAIGRRAMRLINNRAIDQGTRDMIRFSLDLNDPWTPSLVRRAESGEIFGDDFSLTPSVKKFDVELDRSIDEKLEALTDLICRAGNEPDTKSGALLLLMATLEHSARPKELVATAKYLAFLRCCELNICGMVDKQIDLVEKDLLAP